MSSSPSIQEFLNLPWSTFPSMPGLAGYPPPLYPEVEPLRQLIIWAKMNGFPDSSINVATVPRGGSAGDVLIKISDDDYNIIWGTMWKVVTQSEFDALESYDAIMYIIVADEG